MPLQHHVLPGERLTAFSDAVFAIVATIMVIPLKVTDKEIEEEKDFNLSYYINGEFYAKVGVYMYAFVLILSAWYSHNRIFRLAEHVDDLLSWWNLILLLAVSLLPAAIVLISGFYGGPLVITIASCVIITISVILCIMVYISLRQKTILHPHIAQNMEVKQLKFAMYIPILINPVLALFAIIFAWAVKSVPQLGQTFFFCIGVSSYMIRFVVAKVQIYYLNKRGQRTSGEIEELLRNFITKERTIAFSDGIFSIVATIIVLDITTIDLSNAVSDANIDVSQFLDHNKYEFVSYFSSFMIVGLLWFVHHSMFHYIKKVNPWISLFNSLSLIFVGLIPFGTGVVSKFSEGANTANEITSIRVMSVLLILASSAQLLLWSVAHCQKSQCLSSEVDHVWIELIQLWKLLVFPIMGVIVYFVTFTSRITVHHFYSYSTFTVPLVFVLPRIAIYLIHKIRGFPSSLSRRSSIVSEHYSKIHIQEQETENNKLLTIRDQPYMTTETFKGPRTSHKLTQPLLDDDEEKERENKEERRIEDERRREENERRKRETLTSSEVKAKVDL